MGCKSQPATQETSLMQTIYIRHQSPAFLQSEALSKEFVAAAFDEGARFRASTDPLFGFPVWDVSDLFMLGA
jgi:hypothetical protein